VRALAAGGMIAHNTATLAGVAALPTPEGLARIQRFKQRRGPFLLLAADRATALRWARFKTPLLRHMAKTVWPGPTTLVFAGKPGLPAPCYRHGEIAVRVDASPECRRLARLAGGLLVSASLNRRGKPPASLNRRLALRLHRHLQGRLVSGVSRGQPSRIVRLRRACAHTLRA